jgi:hypothetical protein
MLKRIGLSVMLLAGVLAFAAPRRADAAVRFGIYLGAPAPVYAAPAYPAYPAYNYNPYPDYYAAPPVYDYPAPVYVAPYSYGGYYGNHWREHDRHEMREHGGRDFRGHGRR